MAIYRQDPPNAIQLELVEGCPLTCRFCGVQGIRDGAGNYKLMSVSMLLSFRRRLRRDMARNHWNPRIELAVHGEPTVHPQLVEMVTALSLLQPRELILVSNGMGLCRNPSRSINALVKAGITSFCIDEYEGCSFVPKLRRRYQGPVPIFDYTGEQGQKFRSSRRKPPFIVIKTRVDQLNGPFDKLNTHCGCGCVPPQPNPAIGKRCAKVFRELTVRWDGNVSLCCNDFRGIYKVGNIRDYSTLDALWQSEVFDATRRMLYAGDRNFVPCKWCDAISPRVGLLPDKYGKRSISPPDSRTARLLAKAIAGKPYTAPVLREWETKGSRCLPT